MDSENRKIDFPLPDEDEADKELSATSMEKARNNMKRNLEYKAEVIKRW